MTFVLAAANPANPLSPSDTAQPSVAPGFPADRTNRIGQADAHVGIGPTVALSFSWCPDIYSSWVNPGLVFQPRA
jgi:hypothetical protein